MKAKITLSVTTVVDIEAEYSARVGAMPESYSKLSAVEGVEDNELRRLGVHEYIDAMGGDSIVNLSVVEVHDIDNDMPF